MKSFYKGGILLLVLLMTACVSFASYHAPPTEKASHQYSIAPCNITAFFAVIVTDNGVCFAKSPFNEFAVVYNDAWKPEPNQYQVLWTIGKPTGQLHESKLAANAASFRRYCMQKII